jgi:hypothetical protein
MKDLCKKNVKVKDTRRLFYDKYIEKSRITFKDFCNHIQTGSTTWDRVYEGNGIRNILNRTIDWSASGHSSYYEKLCTSLDRSISKGEINARLS